MIGYMYIISIIFVCILLLIIISLLNRHNEYMTTINRNICTVIEALNVMINITDGHFKDIKGRTGGIVSLYDIKVDLEESLRKIEETIQRCS